MARRSFSGLNAKDALELVPVRDVTAWDLYTVPYSPSDVLIANLNRAKSFALTASEAAKVTLIDTILLEIVPTYPVSRVWKEEPIESGAVGGIVDYLFAPSRGYVETPLLCAIEAKLDDCTTGEIQCIAGCPLLGAMAVCRDNNLRDGHDIEIHGIVSNGQG